MSLFLVQHGQAKSEAEDPERSLTTAGVESTEKVAKWLAASGVEVAEIRHSGKKRAEQTASIFATRVSPRHGVRATTGLKPMDDVRGVVEELKEHQGSLMLVGHLPFMSRLAGLLVAGDPEREVIRFQNAGVVCLGEQEGRWSVEWVIVPRLASDSPPGS